MNLLNFECRFLNIVQNQIVIRMFNYSISQFTNEMQFENRTDV
jgi:hypothetical protein